MTCSVYQSPWLRMMSNRTGENAMKCNSSIQLYSTKKQTVSRNWNRTSSIDHLIHSRTSRKNAGGMKEQEGETGKRGVRRREKPQLLWESWRILLTVCVLRGGSSSTECSGCCWSAQGEWEGWHEGHGPQPPHKASWEPRRREIEEGKTERKRLGRVSPLPLCFSVSRGNVEHFTALWNACLPQLAALLRAKPGWLMEKEP